MAIVHYLVRRAARHWHLFLTVSLGVILATALLASAPLLVDTVTEFALRHKLQSSEVLDANLRLRRHAPSEEEVVRTVDAQVRAMVDRHLGDKVNQIVLAMGSYWMIPWIGGEPLVKERVNLRLYEGIEERVELVAGTWSSETELKRGVFPAVIGDGMAEAYDLQVDELLPLSYESNRQEPTRWLRVTGIARPRDPTDLYWFGAYSPLRAQSDKRWDAQYGAIVPTGSYFALCNALVPQAQSEVSWHVLLDPRKIGVADIPATRAQVAALRTELYNLEKRVLTETEVDEELHRFEIQAEAVRAPLYILTAEIVLLALYYVTMVAALAVRQSEREFVTLRSRGASGWQIFRIQAAEALAVGLVALLSGPGLALLMVRAIISYGPLSGVGLPDWGLSPTQGAWLAAGIGAMSCMVGLLVPVGPTLRRSIVTFQQAIVRPARPPWWQRFYLDVAVLVIGLVLLWRLHLYGGLTTGDPSNPRIDWLLLLSPLALLLGAATILLRILPLVLSLFARLAARGRGLSTILALWQVSRNPARVVLLVLLLTLAMALGILSTGVSATLDVSELERAQYAAGGDVRLLSDFSLSPDRIPADPTILASSGVLRARGTIDLKSYRSFPRFELLGVDPTTLELVGTFRSDFAEQPLEELLDRITLPSEDWLLASSLPGRPTSVGLWVGTLPDASQQGLLPSGLQGRSNLDRIAITVKLRTAQGELFVVKLEPPAPVVCEHACCSGCCRAHGSPATSVDSCNWRFFSGAVPEFPPSSYPLGLHSLWVQNRARADRGPVPMVMSLFIDDVTTIDAETGRVTVADSFEDPTRIWTLSGANASSYSRSSYTRGTARSGNASQSMWLNFIAPYATLGIRVAQGVRAPVLPALASPAFLAAGNLEVGDSAGVWISSLPAVTVEIVGTLDYFPTMYENQPRPGETLEAGFLVIPHDILLADLNANTLRPINANEVWLRTDGPLALNEMATRIPGLSSFLEVGAVRRAIRADPMALGLRAVTFFGYVLTSVLSIVGFATHFYMSARQRETSYGILRTMGLSPPQLYGSLVLEQLLLIAAGLGLGTALGTLLNKLILPGLPITLGDRPPIPPFYPYEDWTAVGSLYLILGGAFLLSIALATVLLWRARIHRVLRIGEE